MGYAALILGVVGMFGFWIVYYKIDPRSIWYDLGLLGWVLSWVAMVYGIWSVFA